MVCSPGLASCRTAFLSVLLLIAMTTGQLSTEDSCLSEGGICVLEYSCRKEHKFNRTGLCPEQGKICCAGEPIRNEKPCLSRGGLCVQETTCPDFRRYNETGLCPEQENDGVGCCNGYPEGLALCASHGGHCIQEEGCRSETLRAGRLDCNEGSMCCILV